MQKIFVCPLGHSKRGSNLYVDPRGKYQCRECRRIAVRACYWATGAHVKRLTAEERLWKYANKGDCSQCWEWKGPLNDDGYGIFYFMGKSRSAHRFVYELLVGKIPDNLELDHLCRNRKCVNPNHLEAVTHTTNIRRGLLATSANRRIGDWQHAKTHCPQGHEYAGENLKIGWQGRRVCRICERAKSRRWLLKRKRQIRRT